MQLPKEFIEKYQKILGNEAEEFFQSLNDEPVKAFRLNPLKEEAKRVSYSLKDPVPYVLTGYYGAVSGHSLEHQTGYVYSQEPSAMYVGEAAEVLPGDIVLDLCAAPGGKSTQIAAKMKGKGLLVSNEINRKRATVLAENLERIGAVNVIVLNENPTNLAQKFPGFFDKILVDAPCSGEGMFRKDPDAIGYWSYDYPIECSKRQRQILSEALKMLKPGGQLIYSTCTFAPEEDEQIVEWLLAKYQIKTIPLKKWPGMDHGLSAVAGGNPCVVDTVRLFPHHFKGEGHFIAKFQDERQALSRTDKRKKVRKKEKTRLFRNLNKDEAKLWHTFSREVLGRELFPDIELRCWGDRLFRYPQEWPDISKLKFIRPGFQLGTFKKNRFEPAYSLALSLSESSCKRKIAVSLAEWKIFVGGNTLRSKAELENGWYLLTCKDKSFCFGKFVNGTIKNFFPKGLRFKP
ncbi:RsmB/NOP family class I SAM-dependent RNA methyltransferase [Liquorilactobacillus oeni]|uniref:23S rRNA m(5)C methyltransferase n=1 Tax=Liquorilactobacillus oeni DSM 19972 TaxID=1423777 RepID=A0A0R1MGP0_9LACO|nr:RsmF rRNA methyltransferase first C-terminal domain-containing protein [Liquorilactobacillus oeni]KRL04218.1 23S rRNA m(5)C methyltransferase [Liquorilactobacillus oeni DSM 19972]